MAIIQVEKHHVAREIPLETVMSSLAFQVLIPLAFSIAVLLSIFLCVRKLRRSTLHVEDLIRTSRVKESPASSLDDLENTLSPPPSYKLPLPVFQPPGIDLTLPFLRPEDNLQAPAIAHVSAPPPACRIYRISAAEFPSPSGPPPELPPRSPLRVDEKRWKRKTLELGELGPTTWAAKSSRVPRAHSPLPQRKREETLAFEETIGARRARMIMRLAAGYDGYRGN